LLAKITLINISFHIPILKLAMWQHVVICVFSFARRALDSACHSLCCWRQPVVNSRLSIYVRFYGPLAQAIKKIYCECTRKTKYIHCGWTM